MNTVSFCGTELGLLPSRGVYWAERRMLVVSDLHLGKSERMARRGGPLLPPYETIETLTRLASDIEAHSPAVVLCLGDSFDDSKAADSLGEAERQTLARLQAGRKWLWVEGNHDPGPLSVGGTHLSEYRDDALVFRHIAESGAAPGEVSGHWHPKARVGGSSRPCFLMDNRRLILPAYGCYTGGLDWTTPRLRDLLADNAYAFLTGRRVVQVPVPSLAA